MIKYQYIRPTSLQVAMFPKLKNLCITVATDLVKQDEKHTKCFFKVVFKHPKDLFCKKEAHKAISECGQFPEPSPFSGSFLVDNTYTRNEILSKILYHVYINEVYLTSFYKQYIKVLLVDSSFFNHIAENL